MKLDSGFKGDILSEIQRSFKQYLMHGTKGIDEKIQATAQLAKSTRLDIYRNAYSSRLVEALETDFTALKYSLGETNFYQLCHQYIDAYPSHYSSLRWLGQYLPQFIKHSNLHGERPYLFELAELEWLFTESFYAAETELLSEQDMATIAVDHWPMLSLVFHPSVRYLEYKWNIIPVIQAEKQQQLLPDSIELERPETCLIWRKELNTQFRTMEKDEADVFKSAFYGGDFAQMCETLTQWHDDPQVVPMRAASLLKSWISAGMIQTYQINDN